MSPTQKSNSPLPFCIMCGCTEFVRCSAHGMETSVFWATEPKMDEPVVCTVCAVAFTTRVLQRIATDQRPRLPSARDEAIRLQAARDEAIRLQDHAKAIGARVRMARRRPTLVWRLGAVVIAVLSTLAAGCVAARLFRELLLP